MLDILKKIEDRVRYVTYDSINIRKEKVFHQEMVQQVLKVVVLFLNIMFK